MSNVHVHCTCTGTRTLHVCVHVHVYVCFMLKKDHSLWTSLSYSLHASRICKCWLSINKRRPDYFSLPASVWDVLILYGRGGKNPGWLECECGTAVSINGTLEAHVNALYRSVYSTCIPLYAKPMTAQADYMGRAYMYTEHTYWTYNAKPMMAFLCTLYSSLEAPYNCTVYRHGLGFVMHSYNHQSVYMLTFQVVIKCLLISRGAGGRWLHGEEQGSVYGEGLLLKGTCMAIDEHTSQVMYTVCMCL